MKYIEKVRGEVTKQLHQYVKEISEDTEEYILLLEIKQKLEEINEWAPYEALVLLKEGVISNA